MLSVLFWLMNSRWKSLVWILCSQISTKRRPKLPPFTTRTLSFSSKAFITEASIEAVPEPVINTTLAVSLFLWTVPGQQ